MSYKQREHYRIPFDAPVRIELSGNANVDGICRDISMGGMGLLLYGNIEPKSCGLITMRYEQEERKIIFSAKFSVAWAQPECPDPLKKRAGIQFIEIDESNKTALARILVKRLQAMEGTSTDSM